LKLTFVGFAVDQDGSNPISTTRNGWEALQSGCNSTVFGETIHVHEGIHMKVTRGQSPRFVDKLRSFFVRRAWSVPTNEWPDETFTRAERAITG
jgi:hypothetical protein